MVMALPARGPSWEAGLCLLTGDVSQRGPGRDKTTVSNSRPCSHTREPPVWPAAPVLRVSLCPFLLRLRCISGDSSCALAPA